MKSLLLHFIYGGLLVGIGIYIAKIMESIKRVDVAHYQNYIVCPTCFSVSFHEDDIRYKYCRRCYKVHGDKPI